MRTGFVVGVLLIALSSSLPAATVRDAVFSQTVPQSGAGCATPPMTAYFVNTDSRLYFYIELNMNSSETLAVKWHSPSGNLDQTVNFSQVTSAGDYCWWTWKELASSPANAVEGTWSVDASVNGNALLHRSVMVTGPDVPSINRGGVVNTASFTRGSGIFAPGTLVSVTGHLLSPDSATAPGSPLPTSLLGVSAMVNGAPAGVVAVAPGEVDIQLPWNMPADSAQIQINNNGQLTNAERILTGGASPGTFLDDPQSNAALVYRFGADGTDYGFVNSGNQLQRGDQAVFFVTGLGVTIDPPPNFSAGNMDSTPILPVTVAFGGARAQTFAVLSPATDPYSIGLSYIYATVPAEAPNGAAVPVTISAAGVKANASNVPIAGQPPSFSPPTISSVSPLIASAATNGVINPFADLVLNTSGVHTKVPTYVRFSDGKGTQTTVPATTVDSDIVTVVVPPYADPKTHIFSNGNLQVNLLQPVGGQILSSNSVTVQVAPVYKASGATGSVSAAVLATLPQSVRFDAGMQIYKQEISGGSRYQAPAAAQVSNEIVTGLRPLVAGMQEVAGGAASTVDLGKVNGQPVSITNDRIAALDALLAAAMTEHGRNLQNAILVSSSSVRPGKTRPEGIIGNLGSLVWKTVTCSDALKDATQFLTQTTCPDMSHVWSDVAQAGIDAFKDTVVWGGQQYKKLGAVAAIVTVAGGGEIAVAAGALAFVAKDANLYARAAGWIESNNAATSPDETTFNEEARDDVLSHMGDDVSVDLPADVKSSLNSTDQQFQDNLNQFAQHWSIDQPVSSVGLPIALQEADDFVQNFAAALLSPQVVMNSDGTNSLVSTVDNAQATVITGKMTNSSGTPLQDLGMELTPGDDSQQPFAIGATLADGTFSVLVPASAVGNSVPISDLLGIKLMDETGDITRYDGPNVDLSKGSQNIGSYQVSYDSDNDGDDDSDGTNGVHRPVAPQVRGVGTLAVAPSVYIPRAAIKPVRSESQAASRRSGIARPGFQRPR